MTSIPLTRVMDGVPDSGIDFEYCAVLQSASRSIVMTNTTKEIVNFEIKMDLESASFKCD